MGVGDLVGRQSERELVTSVLRESARGRPGALLVAGEPGVGKTSLLTHVTEDPGAADHLVLWGRCLRFGAESSPYLPIGQLLTQWHRQADPSERARVLAGADQLASLVPALGMAAGPVEAARLLPLIATVLDRIAAPTPLALVIDDLHWADGTSLDLLAFLMAGFTDGQQLSVLITYRDTDLGEGHRLHGWLADVIRLPAVSRVRLDRLGFADAEELVDRLGGGVNSHDLAAKVFEKADGNPYYTELLVRDGGDGSAAGHDRGLRATLLSSWHRLGPRARELLQVLAIGGRPVAVEVLEQLVTARNWSPGEVSAAWSESEDAGLTQVGTNGETWFHHPLVAEVVASTLTPPARRTVHQEYVDVMESADLSPPSRAAHLALHHRGADHLEQAYAWSLRAADAATAVRGYAEEFEHLHRACQLWEEVPGTPGSAAERIALWRRTSESAWSAGEHAVAVRLLEETIAQAEAAENWPCVVRLRRRWWRRRVFASSDYSQRRQFPQETLALAAAHCPGSVDHALALAHAAHVARWNGAQDAPELATAGVALARLTGSAEALAWALGVWSQVQEDLSLGLPEAEQSLALARGLDDPELLGNAAVWTANLLLERGRVAEAGEMLLATFNQLVARGSVHDALWAQPEFGALILIDLGRWHEASALLRELLGHRLPTGAAADVRAIAAVLAFRTGELDAGAAHLERARELKPERRVPGELLAFVEAEAVWASGRPGEALTLITALMAAEVQLDPDGADELLVLAARAAADLSEHPGLRSEAVALLDGITQLRGTEPPWFLVASPKDLTHPARERLFWAERARCHDAAGADDLWRAAGSACAAAGMVWEEALASYQLARALLGRPGSRTEAAAALRRAARLAEDLGATPILADVRATAAQSRISLDDPVAADPDLGEGGWLTPLTPREREVLTLVVAGRTYAEIAAALFISEKTVSVHVSNLLRKTGTTSRIELAELARRPSTRP